MCGSCHGVDCSNRADVNCGDTSDEDKDDDNDVNDVIRMKSQYEQFTTKYIKV